MRMAWSMEMAGHGRRKDAMLYREQIGNALAITSG